MEIFKFLRKNKFIAIIMLIMIIGPLVVFQIDSLKNNVIYLFHSSQNAVNYLMYFGSIMGGICTLLGVLITLQWTEEKDKDKEIKENVLIVYYDLKLGMEDLWSLAKSQMKGCSAPTYMFFSNEWIKNVAKISQAIDYDTVEKIYKLYGDLESIRKNIKDNQLILDTYEKIFKVKYSKTKFQSNDIKEEMKEEYKNILNKLEKLKNE